MGVPQSIPFTELLSYCELEGLGRYDAQELLGFVRRLDQVYFEDIEAKAKVKNRGRTTGPNRRPRSGPRRRRR
jgi:hypothetical protein